MVELQRGDDMDKNEKLYSYQDIENAIKDLLDKIAETDMSNMDWEYVKEQADEILKRFNH